MPDFIGHDSNMRAFESALLSGKLHHGWILSGPRGLGKAGFATNAARLLVDPAGAHSSMIANGSHPDVITIERPPTDLPKEGEEIAPDAERKRNIGVDQIRKLQLRLNTRPGMSDKRAIIIDSADDMERGAANALLKSLEEPPAGTFFFLVSHSSDRLLPTIKSRCQILRFEPLETADMDKALLNAAPDLDEGARALIIKAGGGSPGQALEFLGLEMGELERDMDVIVASGDPTNATRSKMAAKLSLKAAQLRYEAFLRRVPQRIVEHARGLEAHNLAASLAAWESANALSARATALSLDKQSVVLQMGSLLASLQTHKQAVN